MTCDLGRQKRWKYTFCNFDFYFSGLKCSDLWCLWTLLVFFFNFILCCKQQCILHHTTVLTIWFSHISNRIYSKLFLIHFMLSFFKRPHFLTLSYSRNHPVWSKQENSFSTWFPTVPSQMTLGTPQVGHKCSVHPLCPRHLVFIDTLPLLLRVHRPILQESV